MRSALRCKAHHQGDRCKKSRHHDLSVQAEPDKLHVGTFAAWDGAGVVATFVKKAPKRSRIANRMFREMKNITPDKVSGDLRKVAIFQLEQLRTHFAGR
jgi:hypothetical protein